METLVVEAVNINPKFPKFSNGAVLSGGKWLNVAKNVDISLFQKNSQVTVETSTNAKGYTSIVGVVDEAPAPVKRATKKAAPETTSEATTVKVSNYEDNKNQRIQVQGILQGVTQSPVTLNFGDDVHVIAAKILELTDLLVDGMNERI